MLCAPLGYEFICIYRAYRHIAEELAAAGFPVLRFDYHGTGNSTGHDENPERLSAWLSSISLALDEVKARSGARSVSLFGLRLGATLAVLAAAERDDVGSLVLWGACLSGKKYIRELRTLRKLQAQGAGDAAVPTGGEEAAGFLLTRHTVDALIGLDLLSLPKAPAPRVLVIPRDDLPNDASLLLLLEAHGAETSCLQVPGYAALMQDPHRSVVPDAVISAVVGWLDEVHGAVAAAETHAPPEPAASDPAALESAALVEQPLFIRGATPLFGMLTRPPPPTGAPRRPTVILLNAGAVHHVGPNRMYVAMARAWSALGFSVLRLDLPGIGDSRAAPGQPEVRLYSVDYVDSVRAVMNHLQSSGQVERYVLAGLCSGAYLAFHAALADPRVAGCILINPQIFAWQTGDPMQEDARKRKDYMSLRYYQRALLRRETWIKALRGRVAYRDFLAAMHDNAVSLVRSRVKATLSRLRGTPDEDEVARSFRTLLDRRVECCLVFSREDRGLDLLERHLGSAARRFLDRDNFRLEVMDGPDHTFTPVWTQRLLIQALTEHLTRRYGWR